MREIEIKASVADVDKLIDRIEGLGAKLSDSVYQKDDVFTRGDKIGGVGSVFVRVRQETKNGVSKSIFTLKKMVNGHGDKIECETEISDPENMLRAIAEMNFKPYTTIAKTRRETKIGEYSICVDEVENLGSFVEFERLVHENADHDQIVDDLWAFADQLGVNCDNAVSKGYDVLLAEKVKD